MSFEDNNSYWQSYAKKDSTPILIGIGGALRAGKDTVADYLVEHHDFVKLGMSDALAHALYTLNPYVWVTPAESRALGLPPFPVTKRYQTIVDEIGYVEAKKIPEVRRLLQALGTEVGRNMIDEGVWVSATARVIEKFMGEGRSVIVTGIRYPNELDMLKWHHGHSVYVERIDSEAPPQELQQHTSETSLRAEDFEHVIVNSSSLSWLYERVELLITTLQHLSRKA